MSNLRPLTLLALAASAIPVLADEPPVPGPPAPANAQQWYDTRSIGEELVEEKRELLLTPAKALELFHSKPPHVKPDWRQKLGQPLELAPDARTIPDLKIGSAGKVEGKSFAKITGFSKTFAQIMILQSRGGYLWHNYYRCLATFKVPRTKALDKIFDLDQLEKTYCFNYKGIVYASRTDEVIKALGQPETIETLQKVGLYRYYYPEVTLAIDEGKVIGANLNIKSPKLKTPPH